uniref:Late embryogenesis abundant protein, LEA-14 n=1 Tax=Tanacetum cinerariifolium TaxID=118510 RepID=A0A6L2K433_TANCI|nr:late embryogenesis abundant protein, LEA-14 [Tanacetum cinerariifolium]
MDVEKKQEQPLRAVPVPITIDEAKKRKRRRCIIIWSSVLATFFTIALALLILGLTVFKAKKPVLTVDNVSLEDFDISINPLALQVSLNISLGLDISIENPNKVGVKYKNSSAIVRYKGEDIGNVPVPAGKIGSDDKKLLNLTLTVYADRLVSNSEIYREILGVIYLALKKSKQLGGMEILFYILETLREKVKYKKILQQVL